MELGLAGKLMLAFALDLLLGDPRWLPHPVRLVGAWAERVERILYGKRGSYPAGVLGVVLVVGATGGFVWLALWALGLWHPLAAEVGEVLMLYSAFAARDLSDHSRRVYRALETEDLEEARRRVGMIVGRDTAKLDEAEIVRAAVESVAESTVDGVTAPLFFAALGGAPAAWAYKAVNTLDSMWGHKDERYLRYGWAAARLDDVANFIPARLTAPLVGVAALLLGRRPAQAWRIFWRDGRKHPSPNAGLAEAAMAGALGVQLGGVNYYDGEPHERPRQGDPSEPLRRQHIPAANALMLATSALALLLFAGVREAVERMW